MAGTLAPATAFSHVNWHSTGPAPPSSSPSPSPAVHFSLSSASLMRPRCAATRASHAATRPLIAQSCCSCSNGVGPAAVALSGGGATNRGRPPAPRTNSSQLSQARCAASRAASRGPACGAHMRITGTPVASYVPLKAHARFVMTPSGGIVAPPFIALAKASLARVALGSDDLAACSSATGAAAAPLAIDRRAMSNIAAIALEVEGVSVDGTLGSSTAQCSPAKGQVVARVSLCS